MGAGLGRYGLVWVGTASYGYVEVACLGVATSPGSNLEGGE